MTKTMGEQIATLVSIIFEESPELGWEIGMSGDGGEFRAWLEARHGGAWILTAPAEEIRAEVREYLAQTGRKERVH